MFDFQRGRPMTSAFGDVTKLVDFSVRGDMPKTEPPKKPVVDRAAYFNGKSFVMTAQELADREKAFASAECDDDDTMIG